MPPIKGKYEKNGSKSLQTQFKGVKVFMIGMNQGIFPNPDQDSDEQRRLCYVGMTRSKETLYMCHCEEIVGPSAHGYKQYHPSSFLQEIPKEYYELIDLRS